MSTPAAVMAVRGLVMSASSPPSAVKTAMEALVLIDQAVSVRAARSFGVCSSR